MSLLYHGRYNQGSGIIPTSKEVQETVNDDNITNLPGDCLNLIFKCLETRGDHTKTRDDRNSFGLTCRQWLHIQNNNHESLWYDNKFEPGNYPNISPECFAKVICKLMVRFQNLQKLSLRRCPGITDSVTSESQHFGSKVQHLNLDWPNYSDKELFVVFSWFPGLTYISLQYTQITDKGLVALSECCLSLKQVRLSGCRSITDSGIIFLVQNCRQLRSLWINCCKKITGNGFLDFPKTLTYLEAGWCKLIPVGIKAIISGGGLEHLTLSALSPINTDTVVMISKGCPYLKHLDLLGCEEVELEGWKAISRNCKNLESLNLDDCKKLCDLGLEALCNGCSKLSRFVIDGDNNSCSRSALELYKCKKPNMISLSYAEV